MDSVNYKFTDYLKIVNEEPDSVLSLVFVPETEVEIIIRDSYTKFFTHVIRLKLLDKLLLEEGKLSLSFSGNREVFTPERIVWDTESREEDV